MSTPRYLWSASGKWPHFGLFERCPPALGRSHTGDNHMIHSFRRLPMISFGVAATMFGFAGAAGAQDEKPAEAPANAVVATINGTPVTETDLQVAISDLEQQFAQLPVDQ